MAEPPHRAPGACEREHREDDVGALHSTKRSLKRSRLMQHHRGRRRRLGADMHDPSEQDGVEENNHGGAKRPKFGALVRPG